MKNTIFVLNITKIQLNQNPPKRDKNSQTKIPGFSGPLRGHVDQRGRERHVPGHPHEQGQSSLQVAFRENPGKPNLS